MHAPPPSEQVEPWAQATAPAKPTAERDSAQNSRQRAQLFRNRLRKNLRRLRPWAQRTGIQAYRLYDSDIPEVRLIVERYGEKLVVWEYARRADHDESRDENERTSEHEAFLSAVVTALSEECGQPVETVVVKRRERQRGRAQYQKVASTQREQIVEEGGHRFLVNLDDYLDTGLFLDHRATRALVQKLSSGRRVLNLFGYTGSFTVYAAAGGARGSLTIDLSNTYLDWAERNLRLNSIDRLRHRLLRADVLAWLREPQPQGAEDGFDLIVLDPPTFSNSKRMRDTLDIARDHPWLLSQTLRWLRPGGQLLFSCNHRRFALRPHELPEAQSLHIADLTQQTLPPDFHDPRTRCCYLISRR
ncbi:MAG: class I SAM-dependent methyltransferase [Myxococcales bacterium]|nr:class I SAM-dependent methyltransferase [Myxococcales bacterium]